jgi:hypothetical protein
MKRILLICTFGLLSACIEPVQYDENGKVIPPPPKPLPPQVQAAMAPGIPRAFVFELNNGCWGVGIEASEPRSGRPLRDIDGNWVCNDGVIAPDAKPTPATEGTEAAT